MARYVFQSKYLQQLKENDVLCSTVFEKSNYLLFSKDRPLITMSTATVLWTPFSGLMANDHSVDENNSEFIFVETINYCQDLKKTSVLLTIDESTKDTPVFACRIDDPNLADTIASKFDGNFTDMRMAIFTLSEDQCNLVSRVWILLNFFSY